MLVIRRRAGEAVLIGDGIEIEILECTHSQVKLGIRAPKQVTVLRKEIHLTGEQNRLAAGPLSAEGIERLLGGFRKV
ncbi:MAG TPA: carbon storage regulator [Bryobacteraceae bacterium]|nr:carbon storage regulator [Bryobacteraceae bacterium]